MHAIVIVLLILAAISAGAAAAGATFGRINLFALGFLFFILSLLIPALS
jgi:hypothetical protein